MTRALILYAIALTSVSLGSFREELAWLVPMASAALYLGLIIIWRAEGHPFRALGFPQNSSWSRQLAVTVGIGILIPFLLLMVLHFAGFVEMALETGIHRPNLWQILRTILVPMLIVCSEEIAFRGYYLQRLSRRYGVIVGAIGSAVLWSIMHVPGMASDGGPSYSIAMGILTFISWGVALSCVFEICGASLWAPIGVHYGYNLGFSVMGLAVATDPIGPPVMIGYSRWIPETGLIGLIFWTAIALLGTWQASRINNAG